MSAFDIGGRIVIDGEFDATFDHLEVRAEEAERALNEIDLKPIEGTREYADLLDDQIEAAERLKTALASIEFGEIDTAGAQQKLDELKGKVAELQEQLAAGRVLETVDVQFLAGAQQALDLLSRMDVAPMRGAEAFERSIADMLLSVKGLEEAISLLQVNVETDEADRALQELKERVGELRAKLEGGEELTPIELEFLETAKSKVADLAGGMDSALGATVKTALEMGKLTKVALGAAGVFVAVAGAVAGVVREYGMMGQALLDTERAFDVISRARGVDAEALISGLREASRGVVDASTLMRQANQLLLSDAGKIATELPGLYEAARVSARLTARDTNAAFQGIVNSVMALDEAGLRSQGIFVNLTQANQEWAVANGRMVESLSKTEKQLIAANAVAEAAVPLMTELGIEGLTAAEKLALLPQVLADVKEGFAQVVAAGAIFQGFLGFMEDLGKGFQVGAELSEATADLKRAGDELRNLDPSKAEELEARIKEINREAEKMPFWTMDQARAVNEFKVEEYEKLAAAMRQLAVDIAAVDSPTGFAPLANDIQKAADATSSFDAALTRARENMAGADVMERRFASAIALTEAAIRNMPEMPDITATMDVEKLREWGDAWAAISPDLEKANVQIQATADSVEQFQATTLAQAAGIENMGDRLEYLARQFIGADATGDDFAAMLSRLPPDVLAAIGPLDQLAAAVVNLRASTQDPITIDVMVRGMERAKSTIDGLAARVGSIYGIEEAVRFQETAVDNWEKYWQGMGATSELEQRIILDKYTSWLTDIVNATDPAMNQVQSSFKKTFDIIGMSVGELRGKIESALAAGSTVTAEDFARTLAGAYEDAPLEAARRLDAIAARGFAELQAHPDWAGLLKIPEDVLTGSEAELKAWASRTAGAVRNLERPDLIDWDAFARNFEAGLNREAAREVTIDVALSELEGRGLLSGSKEERRQKVIEALGLEEPKLTFDALFKAEQSAAQSIREQVGPIPLDVFFQRLEKGLTPEERVNLGIDAEPELAGTEIGLVATFMRPLRDVVQDWVSTETEMPSVDVSRAFDPEASREKLAAAGAQAVTYVEEGAESALTGGASTVAMTVASRWSADFTAQQPMFEAIGRAAGDVTGVAFLRAMEENAGKVRRRIAELVAPEVAAIMGQGSGGSLP